MLNDTIKNSLYKSVEKYIHEIVQLNEETNKEVAQIIAVAKSLGFVAEDRTNYGTKRIVLLYNGKWYVEFYVRGGVIHVQADEYSLLTGKDLEDYKKQQEDEASSEIEAERRMSLYNSGYRDF